MGLTARHVAVPFSNASTLKMWTAPHGQKTQQRLPVGSTDKTSKPRRRVPGVMVVLELVKRLLLCSADVAHTGGAVLYTKYECVERRNERGVRGIAIYVTKPTSGATRTIRRYPDQRSLLVLAFWHG